MRGALNCGLTPESGLDDILALKAAHRLQGTTPERFGRKPVDKTDKQAQFHEVTKGEKDAEQLANLKEAYRLSGQFLHEQVITEQTLALLPSEEISVYAQVLTDAARVANAMVKKTKPVPSPKKS